MPVGYAMPAGQLLDVQQPLGGLDTSAGYATQPPGTTPVAVNVRGFDASQGRKRLSRRQGVVKYPNNTIQGAAAVQELNTIVGTGSASGAGGYDIPGSAVTLLGTMLVVVPGEFDSTWTLYIGGHPAATGTLGDTAGKHPAHVATDGTDFYVLSWSFD